MRIQLVLIASLLLLSILVYLSLGSIAMLFCTGWNEAHGATNMTCRIPGIAFFANAGFSLGTLSSFSLGIPHFIAFGLSAKLFRYYWMLLQLDPTSSVKTCPDSWPGGLTALFDCVWRISHLGDLSDIF